MHAPDNRDILEVLKFELDFIEKGDYGRSVRTPWRPTSIFQDSPSCINFNDPARPHLCEECVLMTFVPPERREEEVPCHHIPLTELGVTVDSVERWAHRDELEEILGKWLRKTIRRIEEERAGKSPSGENGPKVQSPRARQPELRSTTTEPVLTMKQRILIVDDDEHLLMALQTLLEQDGYDTSTAWSGQEALDKLRSSKFDLVLLDEALPDVPSSDILRRIRGMQVQPWVIVMQANASPWAHTLYGELGASDVIGKWMARREIREGVRACLTQPALSKEHAAA